MLGQRAMLISQLLQGLLPPELVGDEPRAIRRQVLYYLLPFGHRLADDLVLVHLQGVGPPELGEVEHELSEILVADLLHELARGQVLEDPGELVRGLQELAEAYVGWQVAR